MTPETLQRPPIAASPLSVVLTACEPSTDLEQIATAWTLYLEGLKRDYEILLVDDGCGGVPPAQTLAERFPRMQVLHHAAPQGMGAALRTGIAAARFPLLVTAPADPRLQPSDLQRMLAAIDEVDIVTGYRVGRPLPGWLATLDLAYRAVMRVLFGMPVEPRRTWLGWSGWVPRRLVRLLFGVRVTDPQCPVRLFRRSVFKRVPLQSDGTFVLAEILAKANFLGCLIAEEPVSWPADMPAPLFREMRRVFAHADFGPVVIPPGEESFATAPTPEPPAVSAGETAPDAVPGETPNPP